MSNEKRVTSEEVDGRRLVNYEGWEQSVPETIRADVLWRVTAYRLALFLLDIGWHDVERLGQDHRTRGLADQLSRSLGSIGANLAEGYSRSTGKERAHFYEYALGRRGRAAIGTMADATFSEMLLSSIGASCSIRSSGCW